jgi:alkylation response protein AidB-like acyl-CoA dehydrogenase
MTDLILSRRDVDFLLFEWLRVAELGNRPAFAQFDRFAYESVLDVYQRLAREVFAPHNKRNDVSEPVFDGSRVTINPEVRVALAAFADAGLFGASMSAELDGMSLPSVIERAGMAFLLAANIGTTAYAVLTIASANLLIEYGSPEQIRRYIQRMISGQCFGTMCLSEPQAGSSLADVRTRAVPMRDGRFRLFGNKMWISGGEHDMVPNILHLVLAKIPDEQGQLPSGVRGISLFAVPRVLMDEQGANTEPNDVALAGINHKMGYRGTVNCLLNFGEGRHRPEGAAGAIGQLIGEPGQGLAYMFHMMNEARISVGLGAAALGYTGYLHALEYAHTRRQGRTRGSSKRAAVDQVPIVEHPDVRRMLLAQKAYASGALALCLYAALLSDDSRTLPSDSERHEARVFLELLTPVVKSWPSQWGLAANDMAIQVHGGYGYTREYNVEQFYRDNRLNAIHEGTFGIQALDLLGRKTRQEGGAGLRLLGRRIARTVESARSSSVRLRRHAELLDAKWGRLLAVTHALENLRDEEVRLANAAPYLEAFGHVIIGWLWLDQAVASETALSAAAGPDEDFYRGKLAACDFFFGWELPRVESWLAVLDPVERTPLDTSSAWL